MDAILFMIFAAVAVICGINLVVQRHPISSALSLVGVMAANQLNRGIIDFRPSTLAEGIRRL